MPPNCTKWTAGARDISRSRQPATCWSIRRRTFRASIDLKELVDHLLLRGIQLPILIRFADILQHRLGEMHEAFQTAIAEHHYKAATAASIRSR